MGVFHSADSQGQSHNERLVQRRRTIGGRARTKRPPPARFRPTRTASRATSAGACCPGLPITQDFESIELTETTTNAVEPPTTFAYPPLPWIGARFKFDVREKDGDKCLVKTIEIRSSSAPRSSWARRT